MDPVTCPECDYEIGNARREICPNCGCRLRTTPSPRILSADDDQLTQIALGTDPFAEELPIVSVQLLSERGQRTVDLKSGDRLQIGREVGPLADLCTDNISSTHAEIAIEHRQARIRDTGRDLRGSTNGTYLDGRRLAPNEWTPFDPGSEVRLAVDPPLLIRLEDNSG